MRLGVSGMRLDHPDRFYERSGRRMAFDQKPPRDRFVHNFEFSDRVDPCKAVDVAIPDPNFWPCSM